MKVALPGRPPVDSTTLIVGLGLTAVTLAAWAGVLAQGRPGNGAIDGPMSTGVQLGALTGFVIAWLVMMAAMMLPSAAPLVLLYRVGGRALARSTRCSSWLATSRSGRPSVSLFSLFSRP